MAAGVWLTIVNSVFDSGSVAGDVAVYDITVIMAASRDEFLVLQEETSFISGQMQKRGIAS